MYLSRKKVELVTILSIVRGSRVCRCLGFCTWLSSNLIEHGYYHVNCSMKPTHGPPEVVFGEGIIVDPV